MKIRIAVGALMLPLPSFLKVLFYRWFFGYKIGVGVRIGMSIIAVKNAVIEENARIGHFNILAFSQSLKLGANSIVGHFNLILGGDEVDIGEGASIVRFNEINAILNPLAHGTFDSRLIIGSRSVITAWHKIDFTDRVVFGKNVVFAGRNSCVWTHNRQQVQPVSIGDNCYLGSGVQLAPGTAVGAFCVVGLGSVITKVMTDEFMMIAGVPAKVVKDLDEDTKIFVTFPTRPDLEEPGQVPEVR